MSYGWDAIVVGAGPGGAAVATLLARDGWRVALLDAAHFPRQKLCGEHLAAGAQPLLEALGVAEEVRNHALSIEKISLIASPTQRACVRSTANDCRSPVAIDRYRFDEILVNLAIRAGADFRPGSRIRSVLIDEGAVRGVVCRGLPRPSQSEILTAPVVIAADGRDSAIARQTGKVFRHGPPLVGFKQHFAPPAGDQESDVRELAMYSLPGGYAGVAPVQDGTLNVCGVVPRRLFGSAASGFQQALGQWLAASPGLQSLLSRRASSHAWLTMANVQTQRAHPVMPGTLYVGDAAGTIEPFTGQGMTMALASAWMAYRVLARALAGRPANALDQQRYAACWRSAFGPRVRMASAIGRLLRHPRTLQTMMLVEHLGNDLANKIFATVYRSIPLPQRRMAALIEPGCSLPASAITASGTTIR
ncbi:MAG TPA: NAD(P)/FAD-dependent oxidoreductase [Pirellulales bacterium]